VAKCWICRNITFEKLVEFFGANAIQLEEMSSTTSSNNNIGSIITNQYSPSLENKNYSYGVSSTNSAIDNLLLDFNNTTINSNYSNISHINNNITNNNNVNNEPDNNNNKNSIPNNNKSITNAGNINNFENKKDGNKKKNKRITGRYQSSSELQG
jgi:hypothetical protein